MSKPVKISEARSQITRLDKILKPGEVLHITRRGKPYARLELIAKPDRYEEVLKSIEALPEPKGKKQAVAQTYKTFLYEKSNGIK
jgi:antitoxin (DNA-binding transcriptional repressor) of toxin-antitoxin stability system